MQLCSIIAAFSLAVLACGSLEELTADNFDEALASNEEVLVHFYASWSKRSEAFRPHLVEIAASPSWGNRMLHAQSDINDGLGYTSYIDKYGVTKLPTLVYFRKGHPHLYPYDAPLDASGVSVWLQTTVAQSGSPPLHSVEGSLEASDAESVMEAQLEAHHERLRARQLAEEETADRGEGRESDTHELTEVIGGDGSCVGSDGLSDSNFQKLVLDKALDVFVLFFKPSPVFCATSGTAYAQFSRQLAASSQSVKALHMDVAVHKSPFVFEDDELPVAMLFPAADKRPLEVSDELTTETLSRFAREHCSTLRAVVADPAEDEAGEPKAEL